MSIEIQIIVAMTLATIWLIAVSMISLAIGDWLFNRWLERWNKEKQEVNK